MRKLVVTEFLSLDGVYQAPGDPDEDREGGFELGGWQLPYGDEVLGAAATEGMAATDAHVFGRRTYEIFANYWPNAPVEDPFAKHLNPVKKYVASRTLTDPAWQNSELIHGDVAAFIRELKQQAGGGISVLGSGDLVQTLMANDLVDEYVFAVYPIVLGSGKRLFRDAAQPLRLELVDSKTTTTGGMLLTYRPAR